MACRLFKNAVLAVRKLVGPFETYGSKGAFSDGKIIAENLSEFFASIANAGDAETCFTPLYQGHCKGCFAEDWEVSTMIPSTERALDVILRPTYHWS